MKYLKDDFRADTPLRTLPASWCNWVANFFNTCRWIGFDVKLTRSGRGCIIRTVGATENIDLAVSVIDATTYRLAIEDGRIVTVTDVS